MKVYLVKTYDEFKAAFLQAQQEVDIVLIGNNAGIDAWPEAEAEQFFIDNTTTPTGTINPWLAPDALVTLEKSPQEQGQWSAEAALRILDGTSPADIPIAYNERGNLVLNLNLAEKLNIVFPSTLLRNADLYDATEE
jgi:ABC transporter substrate binding protein